MNRILTNDDIKARIERRSGRCFRCREQVFEIEDGESYVTACPFCHRSFCD